MTEASPPEAFWRAVGEFNRGEYFECHETLEELWRPLAPSAEKELYQGVLQVGVGLYHLGRGNRRGAVNVMGMGLERLEVLVERGEAETLGSWMDVKRFSEESRRAFEALQGLERLEDFPPQLTPEIRPASPK